MEDIKTMEELLEILTNLRPDIDFENETSLIDSEILDSFDIVSLITDINDAFDIEITPRDLKPENFNSADAIYSLIRRLEDEE